jgi:hypothetical protein
VWIGEAKTSGRFESGRLPFLAELASLLDAHGVLLATSKARWPPATRDEAHSAFTDFWPRLRMVGGVRTTPEQRLHLPVSVVARRSEATAQPVDSLVEVVGDAHGTAPQTIPLCEQRFSVRLTWEQLVGERSRCRRMRDQVSQLI